MAQAIIQPTRMRRTFNGWCKGLFAGQQFNHVLNLGCGHNVDRQGGTYDGYWMAKHTTHVDITDCTTYPEYEAMLCGGRTFTNPIDHLMNAEDMDFPYNTFDMVFCNWMIYHCDYVKVLNEICHVLVPKGKLLVTWVHESIINNPIMDCVQHRFDTIAIAFLRCDLRLDGKDATWACGFWGEKR